MLERVDAAVLDTSKGAGKNVDSRLIVFMRCFLQESALLSVRISIPKKGSPFMVNQVPNYQNIHKKIELDEQWESEMQTIDRDGDVFVCFQHSECDSHPEMHEFSRNTL